MNVRSGDKCKYKLFDNLFLCIICFLVSIIDICYQKLIELLIVILKAHVRMSYSQMIFE